MAKTITFLKGNLCIFKCFIYVLQIFLFCAQEKLQNVLRFEMDFGLNFAMCSVDFTCMNVPNMILSKMNNHEHRTKQTYESYTFQPLMSF